MISAEQAQLGAREGVGGFPHFIGFSVKGESVPVACRHVIADAVRARAPVQQRSHQQVGHGC